MLEPTTTSAPLLPMKDLGRMLLRLLLWGELFVLALLVGNALVLRSTGRGVETLVAVLSQWMLGIVNVTVSRSNVNLQTPGGDVQIVAECTGLTAIALLGTFIFAFPSPWKTRLWGLSLAAAGILLINVLRVVFLVWLLGRNRSAFETAHDFGWPVFLISVTLFYFYLWTGHVRKIGASRA